MDTEDLLGDVWRAVDRCWDSEEHYTGGQFRGVSGFSWPPNKGPQFYILSPGAWKRDVKSCFVPPEGRYPEIEAVFGFFYKGDFLKSLPEQLPLYSNREPMHRPLNSKKPGLADGSLGEYLHPARYIMYGDGEYVIDGTMKVPARHACTYCLLDHWADDCHVYDTPSKRHQRLRNLNYTLKCTGAYQLCPTCLERESNHIEWELCRYKNWCPFCMLAGHHKSLCTSTAHIYALAYKVVKEQKLRRGDTTPPSEEEKLIKMRWILQKDREVQEMEAWKIHLWNETMKGYYIF